MKKNLHLFSGAHKKASAKLAVCVIPSISQFIRAKMKTRGILGLTACGALQIQRYAPGGIKGLVIGLTGPARLTCQHGVKGMPPLQCRNFITGA
mgnify:CR=1 FL=1